MRVAAKLVPLALFVGLFSLAHARSGFYSALCVIFMDKCPTGMQMESDGCKAVSTLQQAMQCLSSACAYCSSERSAQFPCLNPEIRKVCEDGAVRGSIMLSTPAAAMELTDKSGGSTAPMTGVEPSPTPMMMAAMEPSPMPMAMSGMDASPVPVVPPLPMDGVDMDMMQDMNGMPLMPVDMMSSEEPVEPSPDMFGESSPMPDMMPTYTPEYTPMFTPMVTPVYTPMPEDGSMMMPPSTMPPMTEPVTEPPMMTEPVTEPPMMTEPVTEPPMMTEPVTEPPMMTEPITEPPMTTEPVTEPPMTSTMSSGCTYTGTDIVTISLASVAPADGWVPKTRAGMTGLVFRPDRNHGILRPGVEGEMCFSVRLSEPGDYHLTAVSAAPDRTENNDMWIKSSKPLTLIRKGAVVNGNTDWYKGYQNAGGNTIVDHLKTVDNRGHDFVITNVRANEMFNLCMSGRSYRYEVYKIIAKKCDSGRCLEGVSPRGSLLDSAPSSCS